MTLYEINSQIDQILSTAEIDEETGEVLFDTTLLESLQIARETKLENIACYVKNLVAEVDAIKAEEKNLKARRQSKEKLAERLTYMLDNDLQGQKFETARCKISYRKSTSTVVDEEVFLEKYKDDTNMCTPNTTYKYDKAQLKKKIQAGETIDGVTLSVNNNISIK